MKRNGLLFSLCFLCVELYRMKVDGRNDRNKPMNRPRNSQNRGTKDHGCCYLFSISRTRGSKTCFLTLGTSSNHNRVSPQLDFTLKIIMSRISRIVTPLLWVVVFVPASLLLSGCDTSDATDDQVSLSLSFLHFVSGEALHNSVGEGLAFNDFRFANAAGNQYEITHMEYIVTEVALVTAQGERVLLTDAHYVNLTQPETLSSPLFTVPFDDYVGISLTFGVAGEENVFGSLPRTTSYDGMLWPAMMGGGTERYHYMRLEGNFVVEEGTRGFLVHTGPTGGTDFSISFTAPLELDDSARAPDAFVTIHLSMDVNTWFDGPEVYDFQTVEGGIMGNPQAQERLHANGASMYIVDASYGIID